MQILKIVRRKMKAKKGKKRKIKDLKKITFEKSFFFFYHLVIRNQKKNIFNKNQENSK